MQQEAQLPGPSAAATEPPLDDKTLFKIAKKLGDEWITLAVKELGFSMKRVKHFEKKYQNDLSRQGVEMLLEWRQAQSTSVEQQWNTLYTALMNIEQAQIAGFLQGEHARISQHEQGPDQEPRTLFKKVRYNLKRRYKTEDSYLQLLPGIDNDQMPITDIYTEVKLEMREGTKIAADKSGEIVNSTEYDKIFKLERLIFFGMGGVGKSTIFDKIAYDWADETNEILNRFKLVFRLKMCALSQESNLVDAFDQLLDADLGIAKDELDQFIRANQNEVLILLDGFDEMSTETLDADSFGSILKALNRTNYRKCVICVSTSPSHLETLMSKSLVKNPCTHVEVLGFIDDEQVNKYVENFYKMLDQCERGQALIETIKKSKTLRDLAKTPMLLLLMCSLWNWKPIKQFPDTISGLFSKAVDYMFARKDKDETKAISNTLIAIGKIALRGLKGPSTNQKFSFKENKFEPNALNLALDVGILTRPSGIKNFKLCNIQFLHKTIQEYCAAKYLQSLVVSSLGFRKYQKKLRQLCSTIQDAVLHGDLLRFCCGDNEKCMTEVVNLLDHNFSEDKARYQSDILPIRQNCCAESQS